MEEKADYAVEQEQTVRERGDGAHSSRHEAPEPQDGDREMTAGGQSQARAGNGPPRSRLLNARATTEYLGISLSTLNRIEKRGLLVPFRTPGGHRRYAQDMLDDYLETTRKPPEQDGGAADE